MDVEHKVSIIIPTYKRADYLTRAINSALEQTYENIEVIVIDDNDPDTIHRKETENIMYQFKDNDKVRYIKHEHNKNGAAARNTGIRHSLGEYVCFLDDDDYFFPTKIEKQLNYLINNPQYKAVYCGWTLGSEDYIPYRTGNLLYEQFIGSNIIDTNLIMIKKTVTEEFGGWDERLDRNQDVAFIIRYFALGYEIGVIKEPLVYSDLSDRSNVANPKKNEENFDKFLKLYSTEIHKCERQHKNAKIKIYSSRYRGVLMNYIKHFDFKGAFRLYIKMMGIAPFMYNRYLIEGAIKKLLGKPLYSYER